MKFYRDVDYYLYFEDFPHMGVPGVAALNTDGTVNIFINTLYAPEIQARTVKHELRHMVLGHFSADWLPIETKELEADETDDSSCVFAPNFESVEYLGQTRLPPNYSLPFSTVDETAQKMARADGAIHVALASSNRPEVPRDEIRSYLQDVQIALNEVKRFRKQNPKSLVRHE